MIRAIAFDFDGVLVESLDVKTKAFAQLFADEPKRVQQQIVKYHLDNCGISRFRKFKTIYRKILQRPLPHERFDQLCREFSRLVADQVVKVPWVAGAQKFLKENRKKYLLFVISATPEAELKKIIKKRGITSYFLEILGAPREKYVSLKEISKRHGIPASEMVYVGDANNDWQAAKRAKVQFIWRRLDPRTTPLPNFSGPCISSLKTLGECLRHFNSH